MIGSNELFSIEWESTSTATSSLSLRRCEVSSSEQHEPKKTPAQQPPGWFRHNHPTTSYICQNRPYRAPLDRLIPPFRGVVRKTPVLGHQKLCLPRIVVIRGVKPTLFDMTAAIIELRCLGL